MGNAGPGGAIPGAQVGGGANASACAGIATVTAVPGSALGTVVEQVGKRDVCKMHVAAAKPPVP